MAMVKKEFFEENNLTLLPTLPTSHHLYVPLMCISTLTVTVKLVPW